MNYTKLLIGSLIGGIVYFLLGWFVYGLLLTDAFKMPDGMKELIEFKPEEMKMGLMFLSCMAWGTLVSFVCLLGGITNWKNGAAVGSVLGLLSSLGIGSGNASMFKFGSMMNTFIDMGANAFCTAIIGAIIGWYFGRSQQNSNKFKF